MNEDEHERFAVGTGDEVQFLSRKVVVDAKHLEPGELFALLRSGKDFLVVGTRSAEVEQKNHGEQNREAA